MPQPAVSKHLRVLREAGFVESTVDAQRRLYRLKPEPFQELDAWLAQFRRFWSAHVDALERHLDRMDNPGSQHQQKEDKEEDDAAQTANMIKEKRNENQSDQRLRGRPGQGPALLYGGTGIGQEGRFRQGPFRWLTVASPEEPDGTELQLALNDNPAAKAYQQAMFQQNQPAIMFFTDDVKGDYERIKARGAEFTMPPTDVTGSTIAMLNDTCGNLIQLTQLARW